MWQKQQLVTSCVLSRLDYCNSFLMGTPNSVIQPMQKVQNTAARLILREPRHPDCTPLLLAPNIWTNKIQKLLECVATQSQVPLPPIFLNYYTLTVLPALRSSSDTRMLKLQRFNRKTHDFRTFSHFGPNILNNLPQDIRHSATISSFKSKIKTFLLSEYFS